MREDDGIRFRHMLDAAREAVEFLFGRMRAGLIDPHKIKEIF